MHCLQRALEIVHKAGIMSNSGGWGWNLFIKSYTFRSVLSDYTQGRCIKSPQSYEEHTNKSPVTLERTGPAANQRKCFSSETEEVLWQPFWLVYGRKYAACGFLSGNNASVRFCYQPRDNRNSFHLTTWICMALSQVSCMRQMTHISCTKWQLVLFNSGRWRHLVCRSK